MGLAYFTNFIEIKSFMKRHLLSQAAILLTVFSCFGKTSPGGEVPHQQKAGISFTENKGQVHDQNYKARPDILYGVMTADMAVHIKKNGLSYQLCRIDSWKDADYELPDDNSIKHKVIDQQTVYRIDLTWLNANTTIQHSGEEALPGYSNYYSESCPDGALNVISYKAVTLKNLYPGINLHYYEKDGELKHDYVVSPGTDYKQIQLLVEGAEVRLAADGSLLLNTPLGKVQEGAPVVFQKGKKLKASWKINNNVLSFEIENYDPSLELIIDPITRLWGTYYGGVSSFGGSDYGYSCATDASGNVFMSGHTIAGGTIIATSGTHQMTLGGSDDAFLVKFNSAGVRIWGTYYGGSGTETSTGCTTDPSGNIYITGLTASTAPNVIATPGVFQTSHAGGNYDGYLVKFNSNGIRLWGTYCGGSDFDFPQACTYDPAGGIYVSGTTESYDGFSTSSGHQPVAGGGVYEAFLVKVNPANGARLWGTFYGGNSDDRGYDCAVDNNGNVYMAGLSANTVGNIIATPNSHQPVTVGNSGAYLVKFNAAGVRQWGTYYGIQGSFGWGCATDAQGNVFMSGYTGTTTTAGTIVATANSHQPVHGGGQIDAYLVKMNSSGVRQWATYYGGNGVENSYSCVTDVGGNVYISGITASSGGTAIATPGSHQTAWGGGTVDVFVAKFDPSGVRISGTYYGGAGYDYGGYLTLSKTGELYAAGYTGSSTGTDIATASGHQPTFGGTPYDAYLVKFDACETAPQLPVISAPAPVCEGVTTSVVTPIVADAHFYTWSAPPGWAIPGNSHTLSSVPGTSGIFSLTAANACGVSPQQTLQVTVYQNPTVTASSGTICAGGSFTLVPSGAVSYSYSGGPVVAPLVTSSYTITGVNSDGCSQSAVVTVTAYPLPVITASTSSPVLCTGESATLTAQGVSAYTIDPVVNPDLVVTPSLTTTYTITGTNANGCISTAVITQSVDACTSIETNNLNVRNNFVTLSPNPTNGFINLNMGSDSKVIITNAIGQLVYYSRHNAGKSYIDLGDLPAGLYVLTADNAGSCIKFVKE